TLLSFHSTVLKEESITVSSINHLKIRLFKNQLEKYVLSNNPKSKRISLIRGKMLEYCTKNKIKHRIILQYHSPRTSFTSFCILC
ncbi:MAG: hypothetical protein J4428_05845, partial [Candidatus Aenigmarchaeota archaeon]|nr:hypothetical protein [Candidatus Aenigmarchaeota archaeon]